MHWKTFLMTDLALMALSTLFMLLSLGGVVMILLGHREYINLTLLVSTTGLIIGLVGRQFMKVRVDLDPPAPVTWHQPGGATVDAHALAEKGAKTVLIEYREADVPRQQWVNMNQLIDRCEPGYQGPRLGTSNVTCPG